MMQADEQVRTFEINIVCLSRYKCCWPVYMYRQSPVKSPDIKTLK